MTDKLLLEARLAGEELSLRLGVTKRETGVLADDKASMVEKLHRLSEKINYTTTAAGLTLEIDSRGGATVRNQLNGTSPSFDANDPQQMVELLRHICGELRSISYENSRELTRVQDSLSILDSALNKLEV